MSKSKSSKRWLKEHFADTYVKQAQQEGYRSRAIYKLIEIQQKDHIIRPGMTIVDLGAAPGGWTEYVVKLVGKQGKVYALDILPMEPIPKVEIIQGDFTEESVLEALLSSTGKHQIDLVISDLAPNISGMKAIDQPRVMYLAELALDFAQNVLKPGGSFLVKVFQGQGFDQYLQELRSSFKQVMSRKPKASRSRSKEAYLLAKGYNL